MFLKTSKAAVTAAHHFSASIKMSYSISYDTNGKCEKEKKATKKEKRANEQSHPYYVRQPLCMQAGRRLHKNHLEPHSFVFDFKMNICSKNDANGKIG